MSLQGYIKVFREVQSHWIYDEKRTFSKYEAWLDLLMMANHKDNKVMIDGELVEVKRGQRITSERKLSEKWGWSRTKTRNFLELLQKDSMIFYEKRTGKNTMIEIANYHKYQGFQESEENKKTGKKTSEEPVKDQSKTSEEPVKDLNNNDNNAKNDKNDKNDKQQQAIVSENIFNFYQQNFGPINSFLSESIGQWIDETNEPLVLEAMKRALKQQKKWNYAEGILKRWINEGIRDVKNIPVNIGSHNKQNDYKPKEEDPIAAAWRKKLEEGE